MTLRADHVAGAFFVGCGLLVIALSGDLPFGTLSFPGAGFLPYILAVLTIVFGAVLALRASESKPLAHLTWDDARHAGQVVAITGAAIAAFEWLGFLITDILLIVALLVVIERRRLAPAILYGVGLTGATYALFVHVLQTPLVTGPFGF
jgi:hypothetical protein